MRAALRSVDKLVSSVETTFLILASVAVATTVVAMSGGAIARYVFRAPMAFVNELATIYLGPAITFLALSAALRDRSHIAIDVVARRLPVAMTRSAAVVVYSLSLLVFTLIAWKTTERASRAWSTHEIILGSTAWPLFLAFGLVAVGSGVLVVRHVLVIMTTIFDPGLSPALMSEDEVDVTAAEKEAVL